jgi:hypothetical protein
MKRLPAFWSILQLPAIFNEKGKANCAQTMDLAAFLFERIRQIILVRHQFPGDFKLKAFFRLHPGENEP